MNGLGKCSAIALQLLVPSKGLLQTSGDECKINGGFCLSPARRSCLGTDMEEVDRWMKQDLGFCSG